MKSVKPKEASSGGSDLSHRPPNDGGRNAEVDFRGEKRSNENTCLDHGSRCAALSQGAGYGDTPRLYGPHAHGEPLGPAGRRASDAGFGPCGTGRGAGDEIEARADRPRAITLGADRGYDAEDFVNELRAMNVRPHVAQNLTRRGGSAIDGRTTRHRGYAASQRIRKRIEEGFGWMKTVAGLDRPMVRGIDRVGWAFTFAAAAYNLVRLPKLLAETR